MFILRLLSLFVIYWKQNERMNGVGDLLEKQKFYKILFFISLKV